MGKFREKLGKLVNGADLIGCQVEYWAKVGKTMFIQKGVVQSYKKEKGYLVSTAVLPCEKYPEGWFWKWRKRSDLFYYPKLKK